MQSVSEVPYTLRTIPKLVLFFQSSNPRLPIGMVTVIVIEFRRKVAVFPLFVVVVVRANRKMTITF